ncbi:spore coat protein [Clostridium manihotivorum]|nr:spore coat protein [Clostridium manihotivorum]
MSDQYNMCGQYITPHEVIQLHELITLKNLSLTKCITMSPLVSDDELKTIIKDNIPAEQLQIRELKAYMDQSAVAQNNNS